MEFRIADTFTDSLVRLTAEEQKAVKLAAFDLQMNPATPGIQLHRLERQKDRNFWSARVNRDVRIIVHRTSGSLLLCYAAHHDDAYTWAERRKIETHPVTGAAQIIEIRELVHEVVVPRYVADEGHSEPAQASVTPVLGHLPDEVLLRYGVPEEWLADVRNASDDALLELADHLPSEAAEALLELATGSTPAVPAVAEPGDNPFEHPDAQRRFRTVENVEELELALDFPWDRWAVFLHPTQRELVERIYNGPARVAGTAGTGKTVVAIHRAVWLARTNPDARVLLTTFSEPLAAALRSKVRRLAGNEPRLTERIEIESLNKVGERVYAAHFRRREVARADDIREVVSEAVANASSTRFSPPFLLSEWEHVVDAWTLTTWEQYRDVPRSGRRTRLREEQRAELWTVFKRVYQWLAERRLMTYSQMFDRLAERFQEIERPPFDFVVVDEAQDLGVAQLRFLAAIGRERPDALYFAGDLGQRIFQRPFSWKALGVDVRGRSRTLRINYRTSHQIRRQADRLLGTELSDLDGVTEDRRGTVSAFNGPLPVIRHLSSVEEEQEATAQWLRERVEEGLTADEIGVFVRSESELERAEAALKLANIAFSVLDATLQGNAGMASLTTMHLAKGLEFRAVVVMACDEDILPLYERMEAAADEAELEEVYDTERHLLYVACTRARDHLLVTSGVSPSEFLDDLVGR